MKVLTWKKNLPNTADPALAISPALIETLLSRVADEVTCRLQPQNTEPLPGPSSEKQPPSHKPAQCCWPPRKNKFVGGANHVTGRFFDSSCLPIVWKVQKKCKSRSGHFLNVHTSQDHSLSWFHTRCLLYGLFHMSFHLLIHSSRRN